MNHIRNPQQQPESIPVPDGYFSLAVISDRFGYHVQHLRRLIRSGRVQAVRYGTKGNWYVELSSLENHLRSVADGRPTAGAQANAKPIQREVVPGDSEIFPNIESAMTRVPVERPAVTTGAKTSGALLKAALAGVGVAAFLFVAPALESRGVFTQSRSAITARITDALAVASKPFQYLASITDGLYTVEYPQIPLFTPRVIAVINEATPQNPNQSSQINPDRYSQNSSPTHNGDSQSQLPNSSGGDNIVYVSADLSAIESQLTALTDFVVTLNGQVQNVRPSEVMPQYFYSPTYQQPSHALDTDDLRSQSLTALGATSLNTLTVTGATRLTEDLEIAGTASISEDLYVFGNIGIGTSSAPNQLTVVGSGSFTGQLKATRNPTVAHTGTWPSFTGANDATVYINPSSPVADGNVIVYANGSDTKFVVDAEGDIYGKSLILTGTTTQGTTLTQGDLTVEGSTQLGDAVGDKIKFVGSIQPFSLTSNIFSVQASPSWTGDYYIRTLDSSSNAVFVVASTSYVGIGKPIPLTNLDVVGSASVSQHFEIGGNLILTGTVVGSGTASNSFAGSLDITKGLRAAHITGTGLTINGSGALSTLTVTGLASFSNASASAGFESNYVKTDSLTTSTGTLTINAFTLGGALSANSNNILSVGHFTTSSASVSTNFEVGGTASISGTTTLRGLTYTWPSTQSSNKFLRTDGSGLLTWATAGVASNSLDFDEFVNSMTLDANLTIASTSNNYTWDFNDTQVSFAGGRILSNGNVGIGTTTPLAIQHNQVSNNLPIFIGSKASMTGTQYANTYFYNDANGSYVQYGLNLYYDTGGNTARFDTGRSGWGWAFDGRSTVDTAQLNYVNSSGTFSNKITIKNDGNVGIGTTGPTGLMDIKHSGSTEDKVVFVTHDQNGNEILKFMHGSVGSGNYEGEITSKDSDGTARWRLAGNSNGISYINAGTVGIGITNPTHKLHVVTDTLGNYAARIFNDGNADSRYGLVIQSGRDDSTSVNNSISFTDGDNTDQGSITFTSGTVSYNAFTAGHNARMPDADNAAGYPYGTLICTNSLLLNPDQERGIEYDAVRCGEPYARNVLGAYAGKYSHKPNLHQVYVLGDGHILVNGENGNIEVGDPITTSSTAGQGMKATVAGMVIGYAQENISFPAPDAISLVAVQYGLDYWMPALADVVPESGDVYVSSSGLPGLDGILDAVRAMLADGSLAVVRAVEGVFAKLTTDELEVTGAATFRATGITITDSTTGQPVCVISDNNVLKSLPGACTAATPSPAPTPQESPPASPTPLPSPEPTAEPSPEPAPTETPPASPTPEPTPEETPTPEPTPDATPEPPIE